MRNIAVIGCGYWGKNLVRNFYNLKALHTVCDVDKDKEKEIVGKYKKINFTSSCQKVFDNSEIKAVAIATPAATHFSLAKETLCSNKDVFVEKPLALKVEEGKELIKLAEEKGKILMVGHVLQYHPAIAKLKELISSYRLGGIQYIYSNRLNIGKLRTEENILWSFAPHDISVILMLLEQEPIQVSAFGGCYLNKEIYDTTLTTIEFKNNTKGHIFVSWLHPYREQKLIVVGSKAMAVFDDVSNEKLFLYPHKIEWKNGKIPVAQKANHEVIPVDKKEPLKLEIEHFVECITERKQPKTDGYEGVRVLRILQAAENSLKNQYRFLTVDSEIEI